jgi:hypothetical protein
MDCSVQLTSGHLLFDHARMRDLLNLFERSRETSRQQRLMRAVLDLFYVHTWLEESLFAFRFPHKSKGPLNEVVNRLEELAPTSSDYYAHSLDFVKYLRENMAEQERTFMTEPRVLSHPTSFDSEVLVQRRQTLDDVCHLLSALE